MEHIKGGHVEQLTEYKCSDESQWGTPEAVADYLNRMASEGWSICDIHSEHLWSDYKFIFMRPIDAMPKELEKGGTNAKD